MFPRSISAPVFSLRAFPVWVVSSWLLVAVSCFANIPSGGNGTGPNVALVNNGDGTVTMSNGLVKAVIQISTAQVLQYWYNGFQVTDGGTAANNGFYWQGSSGASDTLATVVDPATNGGNWAEIVLTDNYTNNSSNANAYRYFAMFRGSPGMYVAQVNWHMTNMPAGGVGIPSLTCKLGSDIFNWLGQDTGRNVLMPRNADLAAGVGGINNATKEVSLIVQGQLAGRFDNKYDYSGDLGALGFSGWCSTNQTTNFGLWMVHPSDEYFSDGPMHREILAQMIIVQGTFTGVHFGFHPDMNVAAEENWVMVDGPFLLYFNQVAAGATNPAAALYADAQAQTMAERWAWPYTWFADTNYVAAAGRGKVKGQIVIADSGNSNASPANLWVGVAQQPGTPTSPAPTDFQLWGKNYQYWTKTDANGNFVISNVVAGTNYTLFAFGPGAIGQFQSQPLTGASPTVTINTPAVPFSVTVTGGQTNNLGIVTWTPSRVGATVWEIGVPDRDTTEFRHGMDYWHGDIGNATNLPANWAPWEDFSADFPNGLTYTVGQSHWATDWDYAQGTVLDPTTGNLNANTWTISFNLPSGTPVGAQASIYLGIASDYGGPIIVQVNGNNIAGSTGFFPSYSDSTSANDAMIRMGSHGIFSDYRINFSGYLVTGTNTVVLTVRKGGYLSNSAMYDYVRLELAGYVPPAPAGVMANAGNGVASLWWRAVPGAMGYTVLRSTTSGSGYVGVVTNIPGPVCGSVDDTVAFADTNVVNGTTYYYVVRSVNSSGSSANSAPASAMASAGSPGAPATPVNVMATAGNNQVALTWNAVSGAARYIVQRTVLTTGAVTTYVPGGINPFAVINSYVTGTNYTDTALANNVAYSYTVSAANANGQSAASSAVNAMADPALPATPTGVAVTVSSNQVTVTWNPEAGADKYVVQRGTTAAGPYATVSDPDWLSFYVDAGLSYNTTYYYEVAAANLAGISTNSAYVTVTTPPAPPAPISAIPGNGLAFIGWGGSAGATNYVVQRSTVSGGPYTTVGATANLNYSDTGIANGTTYYYVVYAVGTNGTSPLSAQAAVTPSATPQMIKSDTTNMDTSSDWSGVAPATNEVGLFNNIISAANEATLILGANVGVGGLIFSNNLNGPVTVAAGDTLTLGSAGIDMSRANKSVTFNNAITLAALQAWSVTNNQSLTVNGAFTSASNSVIFTGGGTLYLGSISSDGGANIQVNAGTVQANASSGIMISLNGGNFNVNASDGNPINVMSASSEQNVGGNRTWFGNLTGSGPLTVTAANTHTWSGNNTNYTGTITLQGAGTLRLSAVTAVGPATAYNFNAGTMSANTGGLFMLGSLAGTGTINTAAGENFSIGALGGSTIYSGVIAGAGYVQKDGSGMLTLSGANTYSGGTMINSGVLLVGNASGSGTGSGAVTVNSGGTLGGTGAVAGPTIVQSGGTLSPGANSIGALIFSNSLILAAGCMNEFRLSKSPFTNDMVQVAGALTNGGALVVANTGGGTLAGGDSFRLFNAGSYNGGFSSVTLPALSSGLVWNTNALNTNGTILVVALTAPVNLGMRSAGNNLVISGSGATANWPYVVLTATNLNAAWTPIVTNYMDGAGNVNLVLTNALSAGQMQLFYRLEVQ